MPLSKAARLAEFLDRLSNSKRCSNADEALRQVSDILNAVEDELSGIPNQPDNHRSDDRLYPPQSDAARSVDGHPELTRYRSVSHNTYVSDDGAILITKGMRDMLFSKPSSTGSEIKL